MSGTSTFTRAIVRIPCRNMVHGLSSDGSGTPDHDLALLQHRLYVEALKVCGLEVTVLVPDEEHPDSTFVEDTALLTPRCAVITNPGAPSRKGETRAIAEVVGRFYGDVEQVKDPGTVDAGDIMTVGSHHYIGLSGRTSEEGAGQVIEILNRHGMTGSTVPLAEALHLKTGVASLGDNVLVATGEFLEKPAFRQFKIIEVVVDEAAAANCVLVNGTVLTAAGYPGAKRAIEEAGYSTIQVDVSEFAKLDGGLSCLSLRF